MLLICIVLFFLLGIALVSQLYQMISIDLKARNVPHAKGWTLLSTFGGQRGEGLLLYFFLRKKYKGDVPAAVEARIADYRNRCIGLFLLILGVFAVIVYLTVTG